MSGKRGPRSAEARVRGLLVMLPWLMKREKVKISDMAAQFSLSESDLIDDLELAAMCGLPPYTPLELTEVYVDGDYVLVGPNKYFERRLELTASEAFGLSLLAAAAEDVPGFSRGKELKSALKKLRKVLGEGVVDVDVEAPEFLDVVTECATNGERLDIVYWTPGRNEESRRRITVRSVFTDKGHWYVAADDDSSGSTRHFRVDRMRHAEKTGEHVPVRHESVTIPSWFADAKGNTIAVLEIEPQASWIVETYPCQKVEELVNGNVRVEIVVTSEHWLSRLLLRGGDAVKVISPDTLVDVRRRAAAEMLALYDNKSSS
jgi:proteasome accessory factor C